MSPNTTPFRFAVQGMPFGDLDALVGHARLVESLGYDELFSSDHLGGADPFVPLVVAANATTTLRIGPLVLNNEFHHPALLARTAASVDHATRGRLVLGIGTGYAQNEHDAMSLQLLPPAERVSRLSESLVVLRALLDTDACSLNGRYHQIEIQTLGVRPAQGRVPFLIGGNGRRVVELAAAYSDIFQFTGLSTAPDGSMSASGFGLESLQRRADWLTADAGERNDDIERSALVQAVHVGTDVISHAELASRFELDESIVTETPFVLVGSVEQIVDKVQRLRERLGISHYVVRDAEAFAPVVDALRGR